MRSRSAFTLLETLVAATIAVLTLGAAVTVNSVVSRSESDTLQLTQSQIVADDALQRLATAIQFSATANLSGVFSSGAPGVSMQTVVPITPAGTSTGTMWCVGVAGACASTSSFSGAASITQAERVTVLPVAPYISELQGTGVACSSANTQYRRLIQVALPTATLARITVTVQPTCITDGTEAVYGQPVVRSTQVTRAIWQ